MAIDEDCELCNGDGTIECTECCGLGEDLDTGSECPDCGGDCEVDCPECVG